LIFDAVGKIIYTKCKEGNMKVLVLGGNGATGYQVVKQLLKNNVNVKVIVRNTEKLKSLGNRENLEIITDSILDMDNSRLSAVLYDVDAVVSCLGHNITFAGIWGKPHKLVTDAIQKIHKSIKMEETIKMKKVILMNTTACLDVEAQEKFTTPERIFIAIMRFLLPPQKDNEQAAKYVKSYIGVNDQDIEWVVVRPDTLVNEEEVTDYTVHNSPVRSPVFNSGRTSRINVGNFIMKLLCDNEQWEKWRYRMPVIYNKREL
jgi:putative NADH-flavin reductase